MYIYSIINKNNPKEIYIGKTNNIKARFYGHKSCILNGNPQRKYVWMRQVGIENLEIKELLKYNVSEGRNYEKEFVDNYRKLGYYVYNDQLNNYHPDVSKQKKFEEREEVWKMYQDKTISRKEICDCFGISDSLLSKIITEHGGSQRKGKLFGKYEEIQQKIMIGIPIRQLASEYGVAKNSIANINTGITAYNSNLDYPLNKYVRDKIMRDSWFKPKV